MLISMRQNTLSMPSTKVLHLWALRVTLLSLIDGRQAELRLSDQWCRSRYREEILFPSHRLAFTLKSLSHNSKHRHGLLWHGP